LTYLNDPKPLIVNLGFLQGKKIVERRARGRRSCPGSTSASTETMNQQSVWEKISTAPYNRDLELAVIEGDRVHPLVFACRRTPTGWVRTLNRERINVSPTHWRPWHAKD